MSDNRLGSMDCRTAEERLALLLYGELNFDEEEQVEAHIDSCPGCAEALARQRRLHQAVDDAAVTPSAALLNRCRDNFSALFAAQESLAPQLQAAGARPGWWRTLAERLSPGGWSMGVLRPAGALTLIAIGFFAARLSPYLDGPGSFRSANLGSFGPAQIRSISPAGNGRVNIVVSESRPKVVSGTLRDEAIRSLLLTAAKGSADPGLRAETIGILVSGANQADVREALVFALEHDRNTAVRLRALEALKSYADDPAVQTALAQVLLEDNNRGLRTEAIDLLTEHRGDEMNRQIVGVLQELMGREEDTYVRQQCQKVLRSVKASAEIY